MTQKERLVELLLPQLFMFSAVDCGKLADYLLSNGVIVQPCKVGDTVYAMWYRPISKKYFITPNVVEGIVFTKSAWFVQTEDDFSLYDRLFKKDWFTDREEAEQALKERDEK